MIFWKMSGAGNDFIMTDNRDGGLTQAITGEYIASLCRRGLSVGADGLIEVRKSDEHAFRMKYYNSDGGQADMCGNGARCICRFALELGLVKMGEEFLFESDAGVHRGLVTGHSESRIWLTEPTLHFTGRTIEVGNETIRAGFADTGVPHAVVMTGSLEDGSFEALAPVIRAHPVFGREGVNVNWIMEGPDGTLLMRTWERGVEGETLACGTGAVASAIIASERLDSVKFPVRIGVRSGLVLTVGHDGSGWWLQGESRFVYRGEILP